MSKKNKKNKSSNKKEKQTENLTEEIKEIKPISIIGKEEDTTISKKDLDNKIEDLITNLEEEKEEDKEEKLITDEEIKTSKKDLDDKIEDLIADLEEEKDEEKEEKLITDEEIKTSKKDLNNKKTDSIYKYIISIAIMLLILLIIIITTPRITFKNNNIKIRYNTVYNDKDYKAKSFFKDYTQKVIKKSNLNTNKIGNYTIKYILKYGILSIAKIKKIEVIDDVKPELKLEGNTEEIVCPNKEYEEKGYSALDEYDGDLTNKVKIENKDNKIIYSVKDNSGNLNKTIRSIIKEDKEAPKITLKDNDSITIYKGNEYKEPGYTAIDNCDGDLTEKVEVSSNINKDTIGTYQVTYKVIDSNNNETIVTRTIYVKEWSPIRSGGTGKGVLYLTFDDGPNEGTTNVILDILKEEGVKATFFVTGFGPDYLIKREYEEGHAVALHTATHNYNYVYSSINNYFEDLNKISDRVQRITGQKSMIIRFPGGSSNTVSKRTCPGIMSALTKEVINRGYHYFDWNVDSNDAAGANTNGVYTNVINNISLNRENVVLMHDVKSTTRDALKNIIRYAKQKGFTFKTITYDTAMVTHRVNN